MIDPKDIKKYKEMGFKDELLAEVNKFLEDNDYSLYNLACLGDTYRVMYKNKNGYCSAQLFPMKK